jgi:pimeloyl-ACP methyl ester carboxylesterase
VAEPALERFQRIRYHRRGLGGSTRPDDAGPTSLAVQAKDAIGLLDHVGVDRAHVVGHSLGGAIALEVAAQHPARVASLVLLEPAFLTTPAGAAFARAVAPLTERYEAGDAKGAVHGFLALVGDRNWRATIEQTVPDGIAQAVKDAATFFETELPGPTSTFGLEQAAAITCPVLSVLGSRSSPLFVEGRHLLHAWFPACQDADIVGATHLLQMEAPGPVAAAIAAFLLARFSRCAGVRTRWSAASEDRRLSCRESDRCRIATPLLGPAPGSDRSPEGGHIRSTHWTRHSGAWNGWA